MIEFLDTMYDGWFGRASIAAVVIGGVLFMVAMIGAEGADGEWPEVVGFAGFLLWLMSIGTLVVWGFLQMMIWVVTGE